MFGSVVWAGLILVILASVIEQYDEKLAMTLVLVTLFALFLGNSKQILDILRSLTPH